MNRRAACILLLGAVASCRDRQPDTSEEAVTDLVHSHEDCAAEAEKRVAKWTAEGLDAAEIERRKGLAAASCAGSDVDSATAVFMGRLNVDYMRMARAYVARSVTPAEYNQLLKSRREKLRLVHLDPTWVAEWIKGDADGDLVPDSRDRCPNTADLAATNEAGCPLPAPPQTGRPPIVDRLFEKMNVLRAKACDGAPPPDVPTLQEIGPPSSALVPLITPPERFNLVFTITPVTNQPAACPVFYELSTESSTPAPGGGLVRAYGHTVFRAKEDRSVRPGRLQFHVSPTEGGRRGQMYQQFQAASATRSRIRAVNGNGLTSPWSRPFDVK
jgi:hypothetical protein